MSWDYGVFEDLFEGPLCVILCISYYADAQIFRSGDFVTRVKGLFLMFCFNRTTNSKFSSRSEPDEYNRQRS